MPLLPPSVQQEVVERLLILGVACPKGSARRAAALAAFLYDNDPHKPPGAPAYDETVKTEKERWRGIANRLLADDLIATARY
jgi:hypothetical protein